MLFLGMGGAWIGVGGACTGIGMLNSAGEVYRLPLRSLHVEVGMGNYFSAH